MELHCLGVSSELKVVQLLCEHLKSLEAVNYNGKQFNKNQLTVTQCDSYFDLVVNKFFTPKVDSKSYWELSSYHVIRRLSY